MNHTEIANLEALLDWTIPESEAGRLPSAKDLGFLDFLNDQESQLSDQIPKLLKRLNKLSRERHSSDFIELTDHLKKSIFEKFLQSDDEAMTKLLNKLLEYYYSHPKILRGLGQKEEPPFPHGYFIEKGDFSLLEPVIQRGKFFRPV